MLCFPHHPTATAFVLRTTVCVCVCMRAAVIKLGKNAWVIRGFHEMYLSQNMDVIKVNRLARYFIVLLSSLKYILRYISYEILKWG